MATKYKLFIFDYGSGSKVLISSKSIDHPNYVIKRLTYRKGLYSPNTVDVEIQVSEKTPLAKDIKTTFASKSAELSVYDSGQTQEICKDYIVYQFRVVSEASTKTVHLTLFSRDKLLTLDKFSKVYLNQKLGLNIIEDSLRFTGDKTKRGFLQNCKVEVLKGKDNPSHIDIQRLQFLHYKAGGKKSVEAIQPYRVQYNEDFYSFISRIACQCGEALYFEDGLLTLGPDPAGGETQIANDDIYRIEYPAVENSQLAVNDYHRNFFKDDAALKETDLQYSDCEAFDEYYDTFNEDQLPDSSNSEFFWPDVANMVIKSALPASGIALASGDYLTAVEKGFKVAKDIVSITGKGFANSKYVNDKFKENVFNNPGSKTNNYDADQQKNGKDLCQFADVFSEGQLKHSVLADIRKKEMTAAKQVITIQIKTSSFAKLKLKLGKRVKLPNDATVYVITACRGDFSIKMGESKEKDITEIEIVQLIGKNSIFVPPYNKCAEFTPVQPQSAFVSDAADPRYLGRVRVRYPWQYDKLGSPWVRVLTPSASGSTGCIHFQPKSGDEVMIGYVGGNIERPYVIGSLFGKDKKNIHDSLFAAYNNTIMVGSQRLDFREGSMSPFVSSFVPAWGFISQFIPGAALNMKTEHSSGWHGITRLTDVYNFWKIEGNTAARSVTIDSAWGKVTISAYTGINIEAVGDVTIKGNNINIKAQNNVTIESGLAIKNARKSKGLKTGGAILKQGAANFATDFLKLDLSFIRTIWESVLPPKEGTLKIKSNRYLIMEAGKDSIALDNDIRNETNHKKFAPEYDMIANEKAVADLDKIYGAINNYFTRWNEANNSVSQAVDSLQEAINTVNNTLVLELESQAVDIKNHLINGEVNTLQDYAEVKRLIGDTFVIDYYDEDLRNWIRRVEELKSRLNALNKVSDVIVLKKDLKSIKDTIVNTFNTVIADVELATPAAKKKAIYEAACTEYLSLSSSKFSLGNGVGWADKVDGLTVKQDKLKSGSSTLGKILGSIKTDSDYEPKAYTESQANNLSDGKIIMSCSKQHSLEVTDNPGNNVADATGSLKRTNNDINMNLDNLKTALKKDFVVLVQNEEMDVNVNQGAA